MILLLLLVAASHVAQAKFTLCPDEAACLYHARCATTPPSAEIVLATTNPIDFNAWKATECKGYFYSTTELLIRPLSKHKWNLTLTHTFDDVGLSFGDTLTILTNETEALLKIGSDAPINIPFKGEDIELSFEIDLPNKQLVDVFSGTEIIYLDKLQSSTTSSEQPLFWEKVYNLTTCDASRIIDDCSDAKNCTKLSVMKESVECSEGIMWLKSEKSTWRQLDNVFCDEDKEWSTSNETWPGDELIKGMEIRCAIYEPEPWAASITGRIPKRMVDGEAKKEEKDEFSLINSPFTWVGIGLVGLIALAAVALAIGYAYRKLGKNPAATKSGSKVSFQRLPQEGPPCSQTGMTDSNSEAEPRKTDKTTTPPPTQTGGAPDAEVTRADAPTADTVNRLSMIKTIQDTPSMAPIPGPPSN